MKQLICLVLLMAIVHLSHGGLYNNSDLITVLTEKNFQQEVFKKSYSWVIEFYMEWCGHCINFASVWREFATDIADWDHTIKVGAIDCANVEHAVICKFYNVTSYPHIRLFSSNVNRSNSGEPALSRSADKLTMEIIEFLVSHERGKNSPQSWARLLPFKGTLAELTPKEADNTVVIIAKQDMNEGTLTVMDFGNYPQVYVRTMNPSFARSLGLTFNSVPMLVTLDKRGNQEILVSDKETRAGFTEAIFNHFAIVKREIRPFYEDYSETVHVATPEEVQTPEDGTIVVYLVDMENAISYALRHEVFLQQSITGEELLALQNFINILVKFFPGNQKMYNFLSKLYSFTIKHRDALKGSDYSEALAKLETSDAHLPQEMDWVGCKGSKPHLRGYPCGLWTLFHTLTVNAVLKEGNLPSYFPQEVLEAIHGYIKYFFGCRECSMHFQDMYKLDAKRLVQAPEDEIIWLWKAHNKVNYRLEDDKTEDPLYPKVQFPPKSACPLCFDWKDEYLETQVVHYLKEIYGPEGISKQGTEAFTNSANVIYKGSLLLLAPLFIKFF